MDNNIVLEIFDYKDKNDDWTGVQYSSKSGEIQNADIVDMMLWDDCIELLAYPQNSNADKSLFIDDWLSKDGINCVRFSINYYDAKRILLFLGYELYHEDIREIYIEPLREPFTLAPCSVFREIWTKKENIKSFRFNN